MLYKYLGMAILLLVGAYASISMNRMERRRLEVLDGYISLLRYIKGQINCYAMPLEDILSAADPLLLATCVGESSRRLPPERPVSIPTLPEMIVSARLYMEPETERLLNNFTAELGHTFRAEQVTRCEDYIQALGEERRKLAEATPMRVRINSILSMCTALGLVILLW